MKAPLRLVDDPNLNASVRADLSVAQGELSGDYDQTRGLLTFRQNLAALPPQGAVQGGAPDVSPLAGKALLGLAGAALLLGGALLSLSPLTDSRARSSSAETARSLEETAQNAPPLQSAMPLPADGEPGGSARNAPADLKTADHETQEQATPPVGSEKTEPAKAATGAEATLPGSTSAAKSGFETPGLKLVREAAHLSAVRQALSRDPSEAYRMALSGHQEFSAGILYQEREGLLILALGRMGEMDQARGRLDTFEKSFPKCSLLPKLRRELRREGPE